MKLNDSNLFRQQALINGEWLDANAPVMRRQFRPGS